MDRIKEANDRKIKFDLMTDEEKKEAYKKSEKEFKPVDIKCFECLHARDSFTCFASICSLPVTMGWACLSCAYNKYDGWFNGQMERPSDTCPEFKLKLT